MACVNKKRHVVSPQLCSGIEIQCMHKNIIFLGKWGPCFLSVPVPGSQALFGLGQRRHIWVWRSSPWGDLWVGWCRWLFWWWLVWWWQKERACEKGRRQGWQVQRKEAKARHVKWLRTYHLFFFLVRGYSVGPHMHTHMYTHAAHILYYILCTDIFQEPTKTCRL